MKHRYITKTGGLLLLFTALVVEGMTLRCVQGRGPLPIITSGRVRAVLAEERGQEAEILSGTMILDQEAQPKEQIFRKLCVHMGEHSRPAYVRARITIRGVSKQMEERVLQNLDKPIGWTEKKPDGYVYYGRRLYAGEQLPVFEVIHLPEQWKTGERLRLEVSVEAAETMQITPVYDEKCQIIAWE